jgi:nuclear pore complex protein Nup62
LTDVIEEINRASSLLSNTNGTDDPVGRALGGAAAANGVQLSRVVRVLNSHLSQLQKIDIDAAQLQAKVDDAQKQTRTMGGGDWRIGSDPTEEFYKSFSRR